MDIWGVVILIVQCFILALAVTTAFAYLTLFERRLLARFQNRVGPNRAGPGGFLQPLADAVKLFFKEDIIPKMADRPVYLLAPALAVIPAIIIWAVIPLGCWNLNGDYRVCFEAAPESLWNILQIAEVNVGILYLLAVTSVGVYGITLAGWSSNNKYSMLGGIRSSAQLISYELALGLAVLGAVMQAGTFSMHQIVLGQNVIWAIVPQFLGFVIFMISSTAEVVRAPFDLVEAEQELTGGYNTEYGSMKFALFFMSEYMKLIAISGIAVSLYFGGWQFPGLLTLGEAVTSAAGATAGAAVVGIVSLLSFLGKVLIFLFLSVWIRASWPRVRYDWLMDLGWKWLLPLALVNLVITAVVIVLVPENQIIQGVILFGLGITALAVAVRLGQSARVTSKVRMIQPPASVAQPSVSSRQSEAKSS
ncbi:MAG: NADH-quinone oxidoreductase subunit NuoH [Chloroflexales bacterium]|nr:NADH-quinone oxidoreductase subunit NuoH [Chloroflexales bacterium]